MTSPRGAFTLPAAITETKPRNPGYWQLVGAGEPYRLLFPIGTLLGIVAVSLWPLYVLGWIGFYPGEVHARIMIEGFLTAYVIGFLGTALPRLLDVPRLTLAEALLFSALLISLSGLHLAGKSAWADPLFAGSLGGFLIALGVRAIFRRDTPPPGFVLVGMGMLCALAGAALLIAGAWIEFPWFTIALARLLLFQGYLLLPIMGIGAFLLPRFFGLPNRQSFPESLTLPPGWKSRALFAFFCGALVIGSFVLEAGGSVRWGSALRAFAVAFYFFREVPVHQAKFSKGTLALLLRISLCSIPLGYTVMAVFPAWRGALIHLVFITGFSLLTFAVATRVVLGHSGQTHLFQAPIKSALWMGAALVVAMATRVSADFMPALRMSHLAYAGTIWIVGVLIWSFAILPSVRLRDAE